MKIFSTDQKYNLPKYIECFKSCETIKYTKDTLKHKTRTAIILQHSSFTTLSLHDFFNYKIFPPNILQAYPQWVHENREMKVNDVIIQQIQVPPFISFSQKIIMGVRIKEIFHSNTCQGFAYETLEGHVEKGISIFKIESNSNVLTFTIETYSASSNFVLSIFQPLASLYQDYCTKKALNYTVGILTCSSGG